MPRSTTAGVAAQPSITSVSFSGSHGPGGGLTGDHGHDDNFAAGYSDGDGYALSVANGIFDGTVSGLS
ncbi:hypothetical protein [Streptomyces monashensis]|uniref:Uncharacterized protein n=1 Tax=Streptomyces monashensis TaxID=1678012 RepID=A0A1S2NVG6_9ACTN|nr:hypothetical protein [Streptomyces monashensis]OIJ85156.1 hypothetical protein BIV23_44700 [Streptomyces monashensis]